MLVHLSTPRDAGEEGSVAARKIADLLVIGIFAGGVIAHWGLQPRRVLAAADSAHEPAAPHAIQRTTNYIATSDGVQLSCTDDGPRPGQPVVFRHPP